MKLRFLSVVLGLFCSGCAHLETNPCGILVPPKTADVDLIDFFKVCHKNGFSAHDKSRRYYGTYAFGHQAETKAQKEAAKLVRKDITGGRDNQKIPLNDFELFKHFYYGKHYWALYYIPTAEYRSLRAKIKH